MDSDFVEVDIEPDISILEPTVEVTISGGFGAFLVFNHPNRPFSQIDN